MALAPRLEPDPFDETVEAMLRNPALLADLDEQHAMLDRGELRTFTNDEVRARLERLGVPLLDDPPPEA